MFEADVRANDWRRPLPMPERFCNYDRLIETMRSRGLAGVILFSMENIYYVSSFRCMGRQHDEPAAAALFISADDPDHPMLVLPEQDFAHFGVQPTWVEDIRHYRSSISPLDLGSDEVSLDRYIPESMRDSARAHRGREIFSLDFASACQRALHDMGLGSSVVGSDEVLLAERLTGGTASIEDASGALLFARQVKTPEELRFLREATALNERAIRSTVEAWSEGMTWRDLNIRYNVEVASLGGFVADPGGIVVANPVEDSSFGISVGVEDFVIERGQQIVFDCHGTLRGYCWDGGKPWTVGGEAPTETEELLDATAQSLIAMADLVRPGMTTSELQAVGRDVLRKEGVPNPESALIYFHGLGLSHSDQEQEQRVEDARRNPGWRFEEGMVIATHVFYPGDRWSRTFWEDILVITADGGESLFTWDHEPLRV